MRNWTVIAVAALALSALSGVAAYEHAAPRAGDWQEIAWPFPRDGWPAGRAFRCGAGACGDCEHCNGRTEWIEMSGCNDQSDNRGEHRKQHHARFHERDKGRQPHRRR